MEDRLICLRIAVSFKQMPQLAKFQGIAYCTCQHHKAALYTVKLLAFSLLHKNNKLVIIIRTNKHLQKKKNWIYIWGK